jgi:cytoskeletal protein CcmA (bactofilin family)
MEGNMWKKEDTPMQTPTPHPEPPPRSERSAPTGGGKPAERATIGRSITIRGDVTGDEDLLIQGRVDGSVNLKQHAVTVGAEGEVKASIIGRVVIVEGRVEGNITSEEQVILRSSAYVHGDITAPRLVLEDGSRFRGGVDMGDVSDKNDSTGTLSGSQSKRPMETSTPATTPSQSSADATKNVSDGGGDKGKGGLDTSSTKGKTGAEAAEART